MPPLARLWTISYLPSKMVPGSREVTAGSLRVDSLQCYAAATLVPQDGQKTAPGGSFWPQLKQKAAPDAGVPGAGAAPALAAGGDPAAAAGGAVAAGGAGGAVCGAGGPPCIASRIMPGSIAPTPAPMPSPRPAPITPPPPPGCWAASPIARAVLNLR